MPTVGYTHEQQGFRTRSNPRPYAHLRGLGDSNTFGTCVQAYDANGNAVACNDPNAAVWIDANGNAVPAGTSTGVSAVTANAPPSSAAIPDGAIVIYQGQWQTTYSTWGPMDVVNAVKPILAQHGLALRSESINAPTAAKLGLASIPFGITLTLQVNTGLGGFGKPDDVASVVDGAVYQAIGHMPVASAITSVQGASTGQPGPATAPGSSQAPPQPTFTTWLESNAWWLALLAGGVIILPRLL